MNELIIVRFFQKVMPDFQMQICPAYDTREELFMRNVTNNTSDYNYVQYMIYYNV